MEKEKLKSFRLSRGKMSENTSFGDISKKDWWKFKKMSYKINYGYTAILFIGFGLLVPALLPIGIIAGIIWIKHKLFDPRVVTIASNTISLKEIKKIFGKEADNLSDEEVEKLFMNLPTEKQMEVAFNNKPEQGK